MEDQKKGSNTLPSACTSVNSIPHENRTQYRCQMQGNFWQLFLSGKSNLTLRHSLLLCSVFSNIREQMQNTPPGSHSHILMTRGGPSGFLGSEILAKSDFWVCERCQDFFRLRKITERFLGVAKKGLRDFFGYAKKVVIFLGRQILKLWFFGDKNMNLCRTPPSLKFVSGAPAPPPPPPAPWPHTLLFSNLLHSIEWGMFNNKYTQVRGILQVYVSDITQWSSVEGEREMEDKWNLSSLLPPSLRLCLIMFMVTAEEQNKCTCTPTLPLNTTRHSLYSWLTINNLSDIFWLTFQSFPSVKTRPKLKLNLGS